MVHSFFTFSRVKGLTLFNTKFERRMQDFNRPLPVPVYIYNGRAQKASVISGFYMQRLTHLFLKTGIPERPELINSAFHAQLDTDSHMKSFFIHSCR